MLYFDEFTDFKLFLLAPNDFFVLRIVEYIATKYVCCSDFALRLVKQGNFLDVADLSFDVRFAKYYHFSLN